ncbi:MAG: phospholipase D family protein [Burkholderiaceae bacterium]|jgi:phosphatidylserine/phosphatidylglycerophosphate/cardiolipin synthase-like enzyme|nr:phospholipase D family protein [Burkholderiaceae bacterium]
MQRRRFLSTLWTAFLAALSVALAWPADAAPIASNTAVIEAGFSPDGSGEALVLRALGSARLSIRIAAYSFTAAPVVRALLAARKRGVDVAVAVDERNNLREDKSGKARAALSALVHAGIPVRTVASFDAQHSKYAVIDGQHVQTGSYNYTTTAARYNSENVLVLWNRPDLARAYLKNWQSLFDQGQPFAPDY